MPSRPNQVRQWLTRPWAPYILPFALFLLLTEPARFFPSLMPLLYTIKTISVGALIWYWRHSYRRDLSPKLSSGDIGTAVICGLIVLIIWIVPENILYQFAPGHQFNPYALSRTSAGAYGLIFIRLSGSAVIVPIMEELFWRAYLMRYLIDPDFHSVPMGTFTWLSFTGVAVLFGLEHHRIIVGIVAGLFYGGLLIRRKNLKAVILAHGVTNFGLGIYVLLSSRWAFW